MKLPLLSISAKLILLGSANFEVYKIGGQPYKHAIEGPP